MNGSTANSPTDRPQVILRTPDDVIRLIDSGRLRPRNARLIMVVALGSIFVDGWDLSSFGLGTVQMAQQFHLDAHPFGFHSLPFITASALVGALIGGLTGGYLTDRVGRSRMFLIDLLLLVGATVAAALAPNVHWFVLFRFLMGLGIGMDVPVALAFIAEFSAISTKGRNVNTAQIFSTGATAVAFATVIPLHALGIGTDLWRWAIGLGAVPALIVLGLRFAYRAESPMWAARHQSVEEAARILENTYELDVDLVVEPAPHDQAAPRARISDIAQLFQPLYRQRTLLVSVLVVIQAVEFYAISLYTPVILTRLFGPGALYRTLVVSMVANLVGATGAYLCIRLTQRLGLRRLGLLGYIGTATCLLAVSLLYNNLPAMLSAVIVMAFYFCHNVGPGYAGTAMGTLSYPTAIRGISGGYTQAITRVGGITGSYLFPLLTAAHGQRATIGLIAIFPLLAILAIVGIPWDPIGQDVEETAHRPVGLSR